MESQGINAVGEGFVVGMPFGFVALHHTGIETEHWDLMIDVHGREGLISWRIMSEPSGWQQEDVIAERISAHRRAYLTYEGPVSGNRGEVKRVREGAGRVLRTSPTHIRLWLEGNANCAVDLPL